MGKTICDWSKKELKNDAAFLFWLVKDPTHYCRKCGRSANTKKVLCDPKSFKKAIKKEQATDLLS